MADVEIVTQLTGLSQVTQGIQQVKSDLNALGSTSQNISAQFAKVASELQGLGLKISLATAPIAAFGASAIRTAADFQSAMIDIQVATGATADEMEQVSEAARRIGADTTFSASEAADALINLTKNNVDLEDSLGGVLDATVQLAAATKVDLAFAADTAAKAMSQFGAKASDLPGMMNQLYNAAQTSTMGVQDFALGLGQAGGVAGKVGVEFGDFVTALTMTSTAFSSGADAGTSFKTFLTNLTPTTKEAKELAKELGLNFFDAHGKMLPMRQIVGELSSAFGKLSEEQKIEAAQTLFGTDAMRTALSLASGGVKVWDEYAAKIEKQGTMQAAAAAKMKGFWGAWESLKGAIENVSLAVANSGLIDWAETAVRWLADLADSIANLNPTVLKWGALIAGVAVAAGPLLVAVGLMASGVAALAPIFAGAGTAVAALGGVVAAISAPVALAAAAVVGLGVAVYAFWGDIKTAGAGVASWLGSLWDSWDGTFSGLGGVLEQAGSELASTLDELGGDIAGFADDAMGWLVDQWDGLTAETGIGEFVADMGAAVSRGASAVVTAARDLYASAKGWLADQWAGLKGQSLGAYVGGLAVTVSEKARAVITAASSLYGGAKGWLAEKWGSLRERGLGTFIAGLAGTVSSKAKSVASAAGDLFGGAKDWLADKWSELREQGLSAFLVGLASTVSGKAKDIVSVAAVLYDDAKAWLADKWTALKEGGLGAYVAGLASTVTTKAGEVVSAATKLHDDAKAWLSDRWATLKEGGLGPFVAGLATSIQTGATSVIAKAEALFAGARDWLSDAWGRLKSGELDLFVAGLASTIEAGVSDAAEQARALYDGAKAWLADAWANLKSGSLGPFVAGLAAAIESGADDVAAEAEGLFVGAREWLSDAWDNLKTGSLGPFVAGLASAIDGQTKAVAGKAQALFEGVKEWVADKWATLSSGDLTKFMGDLGAAVSKGWEAIKATVSGWPEALKGWIAGLGTAAKEKLDAIAPGFGAAAAEWGAKLLDGVSGMGARLAGWASKLWGEFSGAFGSVGEAIETAGSGWWDRLSAGISAIGGKLAGWASGLWGEISKPFGGIADSLGSSAGGWWSKVSSAISGFGPGLADWASGLWAYVSGHASDIGSSFAEAAGDWWDAVAQAVGSFGTSLGSWASELWGYVESHAKGIGAEFADVADGWWNAVSSAAGDFASDLGGWAAGLWSDMADGVGDIATGLEDEVSGWWGSVSSELGDFVDSLAGWAGGLWDAISPKVADAGPKLADGIGRWSSDAADALDDVLGALGRKAGELATAAGTWAADAGPKLWGGIKDWAPDVGEAVGYVIGRAAGELGKLAVEAGKAAVDAVAALGREWKDGAGDIDWTGAIAKGVELAGKALREIVTLAGEVMLDFGKGLVKGIGDAIGVDLINAAKSKIADFKASIATLFQEAKDGAVEKMKALADESVEHLKGLPGRATTALGELYTKITSPFAAVYKEVVGNSIVPDMVRDVLAELARLPPESAQKLDGLAKSIEDPFAKAREAAQGQVERLKQTVGGALEQFGAGIGLKVSQGVNPALAAFEDLADSARSSVGKVVGAIKDSDWGTAAKIKALQDLAAQAEKFGDVGAAAARDVHEAMRDMIGDDAAKRLEKVLDDVGLSAQQQLARVRDLRAEFQAYGRDGSNALEDIDQAIQDLNGDIARSQIDDVFDDATLTIEEQRDELVRLAAQYQALGKDGKAAVAGITPEIAKLNREIENSNDVLRGVKSALAESANEWRGWGQSAGTITKGFTDSGRKALADFFETGKLDLKSFGSDIKRVFAQEAANVVVGATSSWLKSVLDFGKGARGEAAATAQTMTGSFQGITNPIGAVFTGIGNLARAAWGGIQTGLGGLVSSSTGSFRTLGGAAESAFAGVRNSGQGAFSSLLSSIGAFVTGAAQSIGRFAAGAASAFAGLLSSGASAITTLAGRIGSFVADGAAAFGRLASGAGAGFANMLSGGASALTSLGGKVAAFVSDGAAAFSRFVAGAGAGFASMAASGASALATLGTRVTGFVADGIAGLGRLLSGAQGVFGGLLSAGSNALAAIGNALSGFIANGLAGLTRFLGGAQSTFAGTQSAGSSTFTALGAAANTFASSSTSIFGNLLKAVQGVFASMLSAGQGLFSSLLSAGSSALSSLTELFNSFSGTVGNLLTGLFGNVTKLFQGLVPTAQSMSGSIGGIFTSLGSSILGAMTNATSGIGSAFGNLSKWGSSTLDVIGGAAKSAASAVGDWIGDLLKFHDGGPTPLMSDEYLAVLQGGEYVVNREAAQQYRGLLDAINNGSAWYELRDQTPMGAMLDMFGGQIGRHIGFSMLPSNPWDIGPTDILKAKATEYLARTGARIMGNLAEKNLGNSKLAAYEQTVRALEGIYGQSLGGLRSLVAKEEEKISGVGSFGKNLSRAIGAFLGGNPVVTELLGVVGQSIAGTMRDIANALTGGAFASWSPRNPQTLIVDAIYRGELPGAVGLPMGVPGARAMEQTAAKRAIEAASYQIAHDIVRSFIREDFQGTRESRVENDVYQAIGLASRDITQAHNIWEGQVGVGAVPGFNPRADMDAWYHRHADNLFGRLPDPRQSAALGWVDRVTGWFRETFDTFSRWAGNVWDNFSGWARDLFGGGGRDGPDPDYTGGGSDDLAGGGPMHDDLGGSGGWGGRGGGGGWRDTGTGSDDAAGTPGGPSQRFHKGGRIPGLGEIPITALGGEFVVNAIAAEDFLPALEALNAGDPIEALRLLVEQVGSDQPDPLAASEALGGAKLTRQLLEEAAAAHGYGVPAQRGAVPIAPQPGATLASLPAPTLRFEPVAAGQAAAPVQRNAQVTFNGPVIASDLTMRQFTRKMQRLLREEGQRLKT